MLYTFPIFSHIVILRWFVEPDIADAALKGQLVTEDEVEVQPERVSPSCLDENVCLASCQKYFTNDAWKAVLQVVDVIKKQPTYYCGRCIQIGHSLLLCVTVA